MLTRRKQLQPPTSSKWYSLLHSDPPFRSLSTTCPQPDNAQFGEIVPFLIHSGIPILRRHSLGHKGTPRGPAAGACSALSRSTTGSCAHTRASVPFADPTPISLAIPGEDTVCSGRDIHDAQSPSSPPCSLCFSSSPPERRKQLQEQSLQNGKAPTRSSWPKSC